MPRGPRLLEDGSYYHILTRGNDRKRIFRYTGDYLRFLFILEMAKTDADRRRFYKDYILQERPYELLVDKGLRIS